jgi:hypothetical protein
MAGTLEITGQLYWAPPGWVYDFVLDEIARVVGAADPGLSARVRESKTEGNGGYLDLRGWTEADFAIFARAADTAFNSVLQKGAGSFHVAKYYPVFINQFQILNHLLRDGLNSRMSDYKDASS